MSAPQFPSAPTPGPVAPVPGPVGPRPGPTVQGGTPSAGSPSGAVEAAGGTPSPTPSVAAAVELLQGIEARPVTEHVEIFADVHARLQRALTEIDNPDR
ncbi:hypothetical protein SAMN05892883_3011 [Jatrophihabitans sp. GAS493]|uniref:hypothetical protein n=1 Tax=Jatrophihabitans sp. GAS493 TaxID=1907575 RepID=UPI000BC0EEF0|nr:hypothetical protein [Jatrophihabitans sp. GAS493]SOD73791.1 hypothetical protein SAMN05892883_3011 [Jatrophihabitans sp. GAS493]